jgi:formate dehydrogenase iron-sulfur subunit
MRRWSAAADPAADTGWSEAPARKGFFTDGSICIGCKACEVACKEWNGIPEDGLQMLGMSYDNTGGLGASTWRHVAFIEQPRRPVGAGLTPLPLVAAAHGQKAAAHAATAGGDPGSGFKPDYSASAGVSSGLAPRPSASASVSSGLVHATEASAETGIRWLMSSDVCKHCTHAACLDVCPTGALTRTEFGTVVVQDDVCNGCGYCIPACPFGVIDRREGPAGARNVGIAQKCTLCYDRLRDGMTPACAQACPTQSIQYGDLDELRTRANHRVEELHAAGVTDARLYGADPADGIGGAGAFFLLLDEPEVYGLPPDPVVTTRDLPAMWRTAAIAAATLLAGAAAAFVRARS